MALDNTGGVFNLDNQQKLTANKTVVALERISELFRLLLWEKSKHFKVSPIQVQILIFVANHQEDYNKVGYLAKEFNMTKATVSDAVKTLENKQLLKRIPSPTDGRSHTLHLTEQGREMLGEVSDFANPISRLISNLDGDKQEILFAQLLELIQLAQKTGLMHQHRMCFNCQHYAQSEGQHYCQLLQSSLATQDLRIDCPEFTSAV